jgi:phosphoribosylformylglycinamidine cyclo-ligase
MPTPDNDALSYRAAGVDIDAGSTLIDRIGPAVKRTLRSGVMGGLGGFGALFDLGGRYREPVLVSGTDGVGTKLKLAQQLDRHDTIGIDLVAMCVNDVLVQGAEPLFFLDYFATGKLDVDTAATVIAGIAKGCELAGCALVGGETAEMPGMYPAGEYDLAGFAVGAVEKSALLDGHLIRAGDAIVGVASSGPHANGYSLIRRILERAGNPLDMKLEGTTLADALMAPTTIYVKPILDLLVASRAPSPKSPDSAVRFPIPNSQFPALHALAHITGGGLAENIIRVVPPELGIRIDSAAWPEPPIFKWLEREGKLARTEMWRTFNCGIGFTLIVPDEAADATVAHLARHELSAWRIGEVVTADGARVEIH